MRQKSNEITKIEEELRRRRFVHIYGRRVDFSFSSRAHYYCYVVKSASLLNLHLCAHYGTHQVCLCVFSGISSRLRCIIFIFSHVHK